MARCHSLLVHNMFRILQQCLNQNFNFLPTLSLFARIVDFVAVCTYLRPVFGVHCKSNVKNFKYGLILLMTQGATFFIFYLCAIMKPHRKLHFISLRNLHFCRKGKSHEFFRSWGLVKEKFEIIPYSIKLVRWFLERFWIVLVIWNIC